jgi:hypothetical protein
VLGRLVALGVAHRRRLQRGEPVRRDGQPADAVEPRRVTGRSILGREGVERRVQRRQGVMGGGRTHVRILTAHKGRCTPFPQVGGGSTPAIAATEDRGRHTRGR